MSAAAVKAAQAFKHANVKGSRRALLDKLAELIPEGETMTPAIAIDELAARTGYYERSMRRARDTLIGMGVVRLVGGGGGQRPSYELLLLAGAGAPPELPLRADLRPVPPRAAHRADGPDLFDPPVVDVVEASSAGDAAAVVTATGHFDRWRAAIVTATGHLDRWWRIAIVSATGTFDRWRAAIVTATGQKYRWINRSTGHFDRWRHQDVDVDDVRAREVRTHVQEVHTHAASAAAADTSGPHEIKTPPCRYADSVHAWCAGRVHVPLDLHRDFLRRHGRLVGESDADVEAKLFAFYTKRSAELPADEPIVDNDFKFWRKAYAAEFAPTRARPTDVDPTQQPANVWQQILARIEPKVSRHTFHTWFVPLVQITDAGALIEVAKPGDSRLFADWIRKHHSDLVRAAVDEVRPGARVEVIDVDALERRFGS